MIFFTADTYFGHEKIIQYCNRPFNSVEEMDATMIDNWNTTVAPTDTVYHLGDFCWGEPWPYLDKLNGHFSLVLGNHDKIDNFDIGNTLPSLFEIKHEKQKIILCHYPLEIWNLCHYGAWHLHGHLHGRLTGTSTRRYDVGVDGNDFTPLSFPELCGILNKRPSLIWQKLLPGFKQLEEDTCSKHKPITTT